MRLFSHDGYRAGGDGGDAVDHPNGGGLSGSVRTQKTETLTFVDFKGDTIHGGEIAIFLGKIFCDDHGAHRLPFLKPIVNTKIVVRFGGANTFVISSPI